MSREAKDLRYTFICIYAISVLASSSAQSDDNSKCDIDACDSLVNKCLMTDRCPCKTSQDVNCIKGCIDCLEEKYGKCCHCVDLCTPTETDDYSSHVGDIIEADEQFFEVMTEGLDPHNRWTAETYTDKVQESHPEHGNLELAYRMTKDNSIMISHDEQLESMNCTIAFINRHLSMSKCKRSCVTLGASHFRWFHDGCCECVGKYCFHYGKAEAKCEINYL